MIEKYYTINEFRKALNFSFEKARQLVMNEPGVLKFGDKRKTYRIPESVVVRIIRRNANPA